MVDAADLGAATQVLAATLGPGIDRDWTVLARNSEWTCEKAAEHVCDVLFSYAAQLAATAPSAYVKLLLTAEVPAGPADLLDGMRATAGILGSVVATSGPEVRAYHPAGMADA